MNSALDTKNLATQTSGVPTDRTRSQEMKEWAVHLRGEFLHECAWIEALLADVLSQYFCSDPQRRKLLFTNYGWTTFDKKVDLLLAVLDLSFPKLKKQFPKLNRMFKDNRDFRNILAHNHIDTSAAAVQSATGVGFVKYERGSKIIFTVTAEDAKARAAEAQALREILIVIQSAVVASPPSAAVSE